MKRRALLASLATGGTISTAGCLDSLTETQNQPFQLGYIAVHNSTEDAHRIMIRVMRDGTTVHRSTHDVPGQDGPVVESAIPECDWGSTLGRYEVAVRIDDGDWVTESFKGYDTDGGDCSVATVEGRLTERERFGLGYRRLCDHENPPDSLCSFE